MKLLLVTLLFFVMTSAASAQIEIDRKQHHPDRKINPKRVVGVWNCHFTNTRSGPPAKYVFRSDGTLGRWKSDGSLEKHRWQGHWAVIGRKLFVIYNDQTYRQYLFDNDDTFVRIDEKSVLRRQPQGLAERLNGSYYRWNHGKSICTFSINDGQLYGRLNQDEAWLLVPASANSLRVYGPDNSFTEWIFTSDLQTFLFKTPDGGTRIGTLIGE